MAYLLVDQVTSVMAGDMRLEMKRYDQIFRRSFPEAESRGRLMHDLFSSNRLCRLTTHFFDDDLQDLHTARYFSMEKVAISLLLLIAALLMIECLGEIWFGMLGFPHHFWRSPWCAVVALLFERLHRLRRLTKNNVKWNHMWRSFDHQHRSQLDDSVAPFSLHVTLLGEDYPSAMEKSRRRGITESAIALRKRC